MTPWCCYGYRPVSGRLRRLCDHNNRAAYQRAAALNRAWLRHRRQGGLDDQPLGAGAHARPRCSRKRTCRIAPFTSCSASPGPCFATAGHPGGGAPLAPAQLRRHLPLGHGAPTVTVAPGRGADAADRRPRTSTPRSRSGSRVTAAPTTSGCPRRRRWASRRRPGRVWTTSTSCCASSTAAPGGPFCGQRFASQYGPPPFDPVSLGLAWLLALWRGWSWPQLVTELHSGERGQGYARRLGFRSADLPSAATFRMALNTTAPAWVVQCADSWALSLLAYGLIPSHATFPHDPPERGISIALDSQLSPPV